MSTDTHKVGSNNTLQGVGYNNYNEGSSESYALHKYKMVRSKNTANLPLRSILKSGNTECRKFPGFPAAHSEDPDSALNLAPGPTCSVSSSVSSLPSSARSLPTSQYGVSAPLAGHQSTQQVYSKQVTFCSVLQRFSPRGDVQYSKVSILTPGTLYFREKSSPKFRGRRTSTTGLQGVSSSTCWPGTSSQTVSAAGQTGPASSPASSQTGPTPSSQTAPASCQTVPVSSQPDPAAPTARVQGRSHGSPF